MDAKAAPQLSLTHTHATSSRGKDDDNMGDYCSIQLLDSQTSSEREANAGRRYRLYREGPNGEKVTITRFESQEEMIEAMSTPEYAQDAVMRATVQDLIANSAGIEGVNSNAPRSGQGEVNFYEAARLEALRAHAEKMHLQLGSADPIKKWEAIQFIMNPENAEAVRQAQAVYSPSTPLQDAMVEHQRAGGVNRIVHETGSVEGDRIVDRTYPPSSEQQALIADLESQGKVG